MTALFTRSNVFTIALTLICTAGPALAQQSRPAAPTKRPAATTTRPATTPQRASVSPGTATASAAKPSTTPASANQAAAKPAETAAPAPEQPRAGVQSANAQQAQARTAPARPAKSLTVSRQKYLNAGVGLAAYYGGGLPLGVSLEVDWKNNISIGGSVDYFRYGYHSAGYRWNYTFIYAGARGSYHLGEVLNIGDSKFDPYVGATLGFRYAGYTNNYGYDYDSPYNSGLFLGAHLGSRYLFNEKIGAFAEVGYGVSALRLGVAAKF